MSPSRHVLVALLAAAAACDTPPATPVTQAASSAKVAPSGVRTPVFADRLKQATFERGSARLKSIRDALLSPTLSSAQTTELGFECASLRADQKALAAEPDPIVGRLIADIDRTCGLDVPLAASYVELHGIETKRASHDSVKSDCFGLKVALGDFGRPYLSNPLVTEVAGKFAAWCNLE